MASKPAAVLLALFLAGCGGGPVLDGLQLEDTAWVATTIDGAKPPANHVPTLIFNAGGVQGWAGCNGYGAVHVSIRDHTIAFENLGMTAMACAGPDGELDNPIMRSESAFFSGLSTATDVRLRGAQLVFSGPNGELVLDRVGGRPSASG